MSLADALISRKKKLSLPPDVMAVVDLYDRFFFYRCHVMCEAFNREVLEKLWACRHECPDDACLEAVYGLHSMLQRRFETSRSDGLLLKCFIRQFSKECGVFLDSEDPTGN